MRAWLAGGVLAVVLAILAGAGGSSFAPGGGLLHPSATESPTAPTVTISEDGDSPTGLSLVASLGGCPISTQHDWTIYWSTVGSSGPWEEFGSWTLGAYLLVEGVSDLAPGTSYWWYATVSCIGVAHSNTLEFTQPSAATLNDTLTSPTSATLRWDNLAEYGGQVSFRSYTVDRSINGGVWTPITTITNVSSAFDNVSGLVPGTDYAFEINTTDSISGVNASTLSNQVLVSSPSITSSGTTTELSFGDWTLIGLGIALAALMAAMVIAVRRGPKFPEGLVEFRPSNEPPRPPSPPDG